MGGGFCGLGCKREKDLETNLCGWDVGSQAKHACCMRLVVGSPHEWAHEWNFPLRVFGCCLIGAWLW